MAVKVTILDTGEEKEFAFKELPEHIQEELVKRAYQEGYEAGRKVSITKLAKENAMISDEQIRLIIALVDKQKESGEPNFVEVSRKVFRKYHEHFEPFLLQKLYEAEKDNPIWKKPNYLDLDSI